MRIGAGLAAIVGFALMAAPAAAQGSEIACEVDPAAGGGSFGGGFVALERDTSTQDITMTLSGLACANFLGWGSSIVIDVVCGTAKDAGDRSDRLEIDRMTKRFRLTSIVAGQPEPVREGTCAITVP